MGCHGNHAFSHSPNRFIFWTTVLCIKGVLVIKWYPWKVVQECKVSLVGPWTICKELFKYEGCSNMNASSFITFDTYMLRQNGIPFFKGLYVTFKLAPDLEKNTVYLSSYSPSNEGHVSILTDSMLRTYQWYRQAYNYSINQWNF